jgi:hypothetical protein
MMEDDDDDDDVDRVLSTFAFDSHITQQARKISLMMAHTCRNM